MNGAAGGWLAAGLLCLGYYVVIAVYAGPDADFGWFWIALGTAFLLVFGRDRLAASHPGLFPIALHRIYVSLLCAGLLTLAALCLPVLSGMHLPDPEGADYIIVLGAQVKGIQPSRALKRRLDKAAEVSEKNPDARLILSGGKGSGEEITEALCMARYLRKKGIPDSRLILEDRSTTTRENLLFSDRMTGCASGRCGIVTNDFHVARALRIARKLGYADVSGIDAPGAAWMELHYVVRESAALIVEEFHHDKT